MVVFVRWVSDKDVGERRVRTRLEGEFNFSLPVPPFRPFSHPPLPSPRCEVRCLSPRSKISMVFRKRERERSAQLTRIPGVGAYAPWRQCYNLYDINSSTLNKPNTPPPSLSPRPTLITPSFARSLALLHWNLYLFKQRKSTLYPKSLNPTPFL